MSIDCKVLPPWPLNTHVHSLQGTSSLALQLTTMGLDMQSIPTSF